MSYFTYRFKFLLAVILVFSFFAFPSQSFAAQLSGSWTLLGLQNVTSNAIAVDPTNHDIIYVAYFTPENTGGMYKSTDRGMTWTTINNGLPTGLLHPDTIVIDPNNTNTIYVGMWDLIPEDPYTTGIFKSTDGGAHWTQLPGSIANQSIMHVVIDPSNSNTLYAAAGHDCNGVWKSTDAGSTWVKHQGIYCDYGHIEIDPTNPNIVYAAGDTVAKSLDGGQTWSPSGLNRPVYGFALDKFNSSIIYQDVHGEGIYKSTDGHDTWTFLPGSPQYMGLPIITDPARPDTVYASSQCEACGNPYVWTTTDGGITWTQMLAGWPTRNDIAVPALFLPDNDTDRLYAGTTRGLYVFGTGIQGANVPPIVTQITASANPVQVNNAITTSANFTDENTADTHTATWEWGDGYTTTCPINTADCTITESNGSGTLTAVHTYTQAGVYQIKLTVTDNRNASVSTAYQYLSVYNPTAQGLFSAGQKFTSPLGAFAQNQSASGIVLFGLSYKYQGSVPSGNRQFSMDFNQVNFHFNATSVSSLVISNGIGTLTGSGTINGLGSYPFLVVGSESTDTIRIKIKDQSGNVIYDTQSQAADNATPTTAVTGGNVLVH